MPVTRATDRCPVCGTLHQGQPWAGDLCPECAARQRSSDPRPTESMADDVTRDAPVHVLAPGQLLGGRYRVVARLGHGGMGEVWHAFDVKLRVDVALKAVRPALRELHTSLEMLREEVRSARAVISPHVCRVFDLVEAEGQEFVSMEYIDGHTLAALLHDRSPLPLDEAQVIAAQLLAGLGAIHDAGLVHRDIKPENVMLTRTGRVVLMDLGIARATSAAPRDTISGTRAYMAPEQARGAPPDARADIFSTAIVLAEMVAPSGVGGGGRREAVWRGVREPVPNPGDTPWAPVLREALAADPSARFPTAAALARALEEVTRRTDADERQQPYPGLAAFTAADAAFFFGRELEVEELWKRLRRPRLLALIGPSGAGKSSFLRAGFIPAAPSGWRIVCATPGTRPFTALADALLPEVRGDDRALHDLLQFERAEIAVPLVAGWRRGHRACLVVIDQFEELFTQNAADVQASFAGLLARLALEADVHVLVSLRDDFLFHCAELPALAPLFSDVTPLQPPTGAALRRALVQPALKCGYRFEDEAIVEELLAQVAGERGALPLVAFAMARLWERRDRERGLLTRAAYSAIGGVSGALAQHAEATLDRIGSARLPIVRELCRNLVTGAGTRAAVVRDDLLSVFPAGQREIAAAVLDALIDARLLTSYEDSRGETNTTGHRRVEFVHESLLAHWPRLVQWQAQDAEGAVLRDQLRQAARLWEERRRPNDLLWTGSVYREFQVWRDRYPGALTASEETFATAMRGRARRTQRRRELAVAAVVLLALGVAGLTSGLWRRSEQARSEATSEAARAEASKLLALGRVELDRDPGRALAYTLASLEMADTAVGRRFAVEALWHGPPERVLEHGKAVRDSFSIDPSDDGRWIAQGGQGETVLVWPRDGGPATRLEGHEGADHTAEFAAGGRVLVTSTPSRVRLWESPRWTEVHSIPIARPRDVRVAGSRILTLDWLEDPPRRVAVDAWTLDGSHLEGPVTWGGQDNLVVSRAGAMLAYTSGATVLVRNLDGLTPRPERVIGRQDAPVRMLSLSASATRAASSDAAGNVRVWNVDRGGMASREVHAEIPDGIGHAHALDSSGATLVTTGKIAVANVWELGAPSAALPLPLRSQRELTWQVRFSPDGRWVAALSRVLTLWPLSGVYPRVLQSASAAMPGSLAFDPLGRWLVVASSEGVRLWPMPGRSGESVQLLRGGSNLCCTVVFTATGDRLLVGDAGTVTVVPLDGSAPRVLPTPERDLGGGFVNVAVSPDGRFAAAGCGTTTPGRQAIPVWDLATERLVTTLRPPLDGPPDATIYQDNVIGIAFTPDGRLVTSGQAGVRLWDIANGTGTLLYRQNQDWPEYVSVSGDGTIAFLRGYRLGADEGAIWYCRIADCRWKELAWTARTSVLARGSSGNALVTSMLDGTIRVGSLSDTEPYLLYGHAGAVMAVAVSPDQRWIASGDTAGLIRVWRMPDRSRAPFQSLPREQILAKLRSFTNMRAVKHPSSPTGYAIKVGENIGWREVPEW